MTEKMTITILPSGTHPDILSVEDAMSQMNDLFKLLSSKNIDQQITWKLVHASTNSPFTITAEAVSYEPEINTQILAREQKDFFYSGISSLYENVMPDSWATGESNTIVNRIFKRTSNGIGEMIIDFHDDYPEIKINTAIADKIKNVLHSASLFKLLNADRAREEFGSIEGKLLKVGDHYAQPAILIEHRLTKTNVWCIIPESLSEKINFSFNDVWKNKRVIIFGIKRYDSHGSISRVTAKAIKMYASETIGVDSILDPDFTDGIISTDYTDMLLGE